MVAADAITACDEGVIMEIDPDTWLAAAPDGTPASEDFFAGTLSPGGTTASSRRSSIPQPSAIAPDVFEGEQPSTIADVFDLEKFPGKRSLERRPINNLEWALVADGVAPADVYGMLSTREGVSRALAKLDIIKDQVSGGQGASRRSCWRTARSSWPRPTTVDSSPPSPKRISPSP